MTIGIHSVAAYRDQPTGVEAYARTLIQHMTQRSDAQKHQFLLYADPDPEQGEAITGDNVELRRLKSPLLWTQTRLSYEMLRRPPDVLFCPAAALPRALPKRTIATVHGIEFLQTPEHYPKKHRRYLTWITKDALKRSDEIIAISEATKQALVDRFGANPQRIHVVHHGSPERLKRAEKSLHKRPYFFYVGRLESHKNLTRIVRAFTRIRRQGKDADLLLAGGQGFGYEQIKEAIAESPYRDDIRELGYIAEEKKESLLQHALAFLFPSLSEGFGLPVLEAQVAGAPVITSTTTALPEVAGEGALLVDPEDDEALYRAMRRIVEDEALRKRLTKEGRENAKRFSWDRCAKETLQILTEA